jgi:3-oxoacyl-[acyl-carrier protein] reductase
MMNKNVIILGSEGALGSVMITKLRQQKALTLIAADKNEKSRHHNISYFQADFLDVKQVEILADALADNLSSENILISAIGKFGADYTSKKFTARNLSDSVQINLLAIAQICLDISRKCVAKRKKMRFVIIGSTAGAVGSRDIGYGISKAGLNGLVVSLSKVFAAENITAIGVNPGIFTSQMSQAVSAERQKSVIAQTHLKRPGNIAEIAHTALYAALEAPDFLTGSLININGGQYR